MGNALGVGGLVYWTCLAMTHAANLPRHLYVKCDMEFVSDGEKQGIEDVVWFGLTAIPGRAWGCTVMLKCGALYRGLPLHALAHGEIAIMDWDINDAQRWDCFGWNFTTIEYDYLMGLSCKVWIANRKTWEVGRYLFTAEPYGDGFSMSPSQTKSHHFIALNNGRITAVPGNNVLWRESSFTTQSEKPKWLRTQSRVWNGEEATWDDVVGEETA